MTLKELRKQKGFSQDEVSKLLDIPLRSYKRYESDKNYQNTIKYNFIFSELSRLKKRPLKNPQVRKARIIVTGIGYVGLSNGILLSRKASVTFFDISLDKVDLINNKQSPLPNEDIIEAVATGRYKATNDIYAYKNADYVIIATPTNLDETTGKLDTFSVESVIRTVREINKNCLIIIKSTVPTGFTEKMIQNYGGSVIFCPEFLREKHALSDAYYPSRLIIGSDTKNDKIIRFQALLESSIKNDKKVIYMSSKEAEATKLFSNAYLAMRVAFFNELDSFAIENEINPKNIIYGLGKDPRIGDDYNNPSFMFEGTCLPKDTREIQSEMANIKNNQLISSITSSNNNRLEFIKNEIIEFGKTKTKKDINQIIIGIYNPQHENIRSNKKINSLVKLYNYFKNEGLSVIIFDKSIIKDSSDLQEFFNKSDIVVSNETHKELKQIKNKLFTRMIN